MDGGNYMKYSEGKMGRVFILRLEDGDVLKDCIEKFAEEKNIQVAHVAIVGAAKDGVIVVGPRDDSAMPFDPVKLPLQRAHEFFATGVIAPLIDGKPILHMHGSMGKFGQSLTGCIREGVRTWLVGEVIIYEIEGTSAKRLLDEGSGMVLLAI